MAEVFSEKAKRAWAERRKGKAVLAEDCQCGKSAVLFNGKYRGQESGHGKSRAFADAGGMR